MATLHSIQALSFVRLLTPVYMLTLSLVLYTGMYVFSLAFTVAYSVRPHPLFILNQPPIRKIILWFGDHSEFEQIARLIILKN